MSEKLSLQAQETRRGYKRRYRAKNRERINRQQREWRADNGDKVRQYNTQYWERRARQSLLCRLWHYAGEAGRVDDDCQIGAV